MTDRHHRTPRRLRLGLALALAVAACSPAPAPTTSPAAPSPGASTAPSARSSAGASEGAPAGLAGDLHDAIDPQAILADLGRLDELTREHGGARPAGSDAYAAAAAFVAAELEAAGLTVELHEVEVPFFRQLAPSVLEVQGGATFEDLRDVKAMLFSASGDVTAPLHALGFDPLAGAGSPPAGLGCSPADWAGVPRGTVVLLQPGPCRRHDAIVNGQAAGAVAIITAYPGWTRDHVLRPTLIEPDDIQVPALGVTRDVGIALHEAAGAGGSVHIRTETVTERGGSPNVIAETPGGDPAHVLMLGGHLDSVVDGPGINDNGSGTMAVLEVARRVAAAVADPAPGTRPWKVRFAFWTGEELGLWGSTAYVQERGASDPALEAYLNFDMVGSTNGVRMVYDGADAANPADGARIASLFGQAFERDGLVWQSVPLGGSSDHFPFTRAGITTGGLFSGASELKSDAQAGLFGGAAGEPDDPCYHLACDTVENIDPALVEQMARAAAYVTGALISGEVPLGGS